MSLATLIGLVAVAITVNALYRKDDRYLLLIMGIGVSFWALHYGLMGSIPGAVIHAIAAVSILSAHAMSRWAVAARYGAGISFSIIGVTSALLFGTGWADFVAAVGCVVMTMSQFVARGTTRRYGFLGGEVLFFFFAMMIFSVPGMLVTLSNVAANLIGIVRMSMTDPSGAEVSRIS